MTTMAQFRNLGFLSRSAMFVYSGSEKCASPTIHSLNNKSPTRMNITPDSNRLLHDIHKYALLLLPKFPVLLPHNPSNVSCGSTLAKDNQTSESSASQRSLADELLAARIGDQSGDKKKDGSGESSSTTEQEEKNRTMRALKFTYYAFGVMMTGLGSFLLWTWGSPQKDAFGRPIKDEFSNMPTIQQYICRTFNEAKNMNKMIQEPAREKLLPDPLKEPYYQPPYTLILELKDVLVHPEWTYETGWRFKKRPGVDFLLQHCGPPLFEIVIYTSEQGFTALPVIEQLDPNNFIWYKLFRDSTRYVNGRHLKDLNCVNRDLNKVIVVDWDSGAITSLRNQLTLPRWNGQMSDQTLIELAMMLRTIVESQVSDVREVLDYYRTFDDPVAAFKENQRAAQERAIQLENEKVTSQAKILSSSWSSSFLRKR